MHRTCVSLYIVPNLIVPSSILVSLVLSTALPLLLPASLPLLIVINENDFGNKTDYSIRVTTNLPSVSPSSYKPSDTPTVTRSETPMGWASMSRGTDVDFSNIWPLFKERLEVRMPIALLYDLFTFTAFLFLRAFPPFTSKRPFYLKKARKSSNIRVYFPHIRCFDYNWYYVSEKMKLEMFDDIISKI